MDMAVANLLKHKIRFELITEGTDLCQPGYFKRTRYYGSQHIENIESIGLKDVNDLCTIFCEPFIFYALSKVIHEDRVIPINDVTISVGVVNLEGHHEYELTRYSYEGIWDSPEFFSIDRDVDRCSFPEHLFHSCFYVFVEVKSFYICHTLLEDARFRSEFNYDRYWQHPLSIEECLNSSGDEIPIEEVYDSADGEEVYDSENTDEEEEDTPPTETYRQDCCVICLESKPNILYLDCMHIAICDSCDRLKKTRRHKCDVCRRRIFERVKI